MLQKKRLKLYKIIIFKPLITVRTNSKKFNTPILSSLEVSNKTKFGNTSHLFKKLTFIGLAFSNVLFNKYKNLTIRSVMNSLWNMISTYIVTFY